MGLKITNQIYTNKGLTEELYINIQKINIDKKNRHNVLISKYLNKSVKDENEMDICQTFDLSNGFPLNLSMEELTSNFVYELTYNKIKEILISKGYTVEDLI